MILADFKTREWGALTDGERHAFFCLLIGWTRAYITEQGEWALQHPSGPDAAMMWEVNPVEQAGASLELFEEKAESYNLTLSYDVDRALGCFVCGYGWEGKTCTGPTPQDAINWAVFEAWRAE